MKRIRLLKFVSALLCCILCLTMFASCFLLTPPPNGDKDLDTDITPPVTGDDDDEHICSQPCPVCGGCLDETCADTACLPKCECDDIDDNTDTDTDTDNRYSYLPVISDEMPVVYINTTDASNEFATMPDRDAKLRDEIQYVDAKITIEDGENVDLDDVKAQVKARGNYTLNYEKKPIRIKFDKKQSVLGLNGGAKFKSWVLLADWKDLSMSNNSTAFYLGKTILGSDGYYSSDYRNVEVYLNGEYWGVYLLVEQQEAKGESGRSSAPSVDDDYPGTDIGYLVEYDGYYTDELYMPNGAGDPTFTLNYNNFAPLRKLNGATLYTEWAQRGYTVKSDIYDNAQLQFINSFVDNAYRIAYEAVYNDRYYKFNADYSNIVEASGTAQKIVSSVIDVQSLVDMYILSEIACDPDLAWSSFYISLDMTEKGSHKLIFEAPWDFDSAFGIKAGFVNNGIGMFAANCDNPWLILLVREQWFQQMVRDKWAELVDNNVLTTALELVNTQKTIYQQYYSNNFERWENRVIYGDSELIYKLNSYTTQAQAADYLYNWLDKRFSYLNGQWGDGAKPEQTPLPTMPEGYEKYRFEAEDCLFDYPIEISSWHSELASGGSFLGEIDGAYGAEITLTVYVEEDCTVYLSVGLSKRSFEADFSDWFAVSVNGETLDIPSCYIPACEGGETEWVAWTDVYLATIELKAGVNTITLTTVGSKATNVDYFDLWSACPILP